MPRGGGGCFRALLSKQVVEGRRRGEEGEGKGLRISAFGFGTIWGILGGINQVLVLRRAR